MMKIVVRNDQSPGDIVCMTAAIRDLHRCHPNKYQTGVKTTAQPLWDNNPLITKFNQNNIVEIDNKIGNKWAKKNAHRSINYNDLVEVWQDGKIPSFQLEYPLINNSNTSSYHMTDGFTSNLASILNTSIDNRLCKGDIHLSTTEKSWASQVSEITSNDDFYWIVVNGGKSDYTAKWWDPFRMQKVVDSLKHILFVQVGQIRNGHYHIPLIGSNVINLLDKTDVRQIVRLVYNSSGVICPVTYLMHLAAAVPVKKHKCYGRETRPCVVIAGGREPTRWEMYGHHAYLHTCGMLKCCESGGCWKSKVVPDDENDTSICLYPELTENGVTIPKCLKMISVDDVINSIKRYLP